MQARRNYDTAPADNFADVSPVRCFGSRIVPRDKMVNYKHHLRESNLFKNPPAHWLRDVSPPKGGPV